ncbi:MAG: hypothetical protein ACRDSJ_17100, partial [Rubrobacteraceae bacterium]
MASTEWASAGNYSLRRFLAGVAMFAALVVVMVAGGSAAGGEEAGTPEVPDAAQLLREAESEGSVRVIVGLETDFVPEARIGRARVAEQRDGIEDTTDELREDLTGTGFRTVREYETIPYVALKLTPEAFREARESP